MQPLRDALCISSDCCEKLVGANFCQYPPRGICNKSFYFLFAGNDIGMKEICEALRPALQHFTVNINTQGLS